MFWKIAFGVGFVGLILGIILIIVAVRAFYASTDAITEDIAFGGLLMSVILLIVSFLIVAVSAIFILRNSKKDWEAKQTPK